MLRGSSVERRMALGRVRVWLAEGLGDGGGLFEWRVRDIVEGSNGGD